MQRIATVALVLICLAAAPRLAHAQRADTAALADRIEALEKDLASLKEAAVQVPTLSATAQELSGQLEQLKQRLATMEGQQKSIPDAVAVLDKLVLDVRAVEQRLASLETEVAGLGQPTAGGGGGGVVHSAKGFGWTTADGTAGISIRGFVQPRYELTVNEDFDGVDRNSFRLRRTRLGVDGFFDDREVTWGLLLEPTRSSPLMQYWANYKFHDWLAVRVGQWRVPFTRSQLSPSWKLAFPERAQLIEDYKYDRDIQVGVNGRFSDDRFGYQAVVGNGAGKNRLNDNIDVQVSGRFDAVVTGDRFGLGYGDIQGEAEQALMVGVSAVHDLSAVPDSIDGVDLDPVDVDADGDRDNVRVVSASADVTFRHRGLEVAVEGVMRYEDWGTILEGQAKSGADLADIVGTESGRTYLGAFAQVTKMVIPKQLLAGARVAWGDVPFLGLADRPSHLEIGKTRLELAAVAQLYDKRGFRSLGVQYSYTDFADFYNGADALRDKTHTFIAEWQLRF
jgi:hypothetical protein